MSQYKNTYPIAEFSDEVSNKFLFISTGINDIIKAVEYQYIGPFQDNHLYNLAFGDYDFKTGQLNDLVETNNGDHYAVFNTVLSTIATFFKNNPNSILMVQGSDTKQEYIDKCKEICKKKCADTCRNTERRINTYRYYVNKNYDDLIKEFEFVGGETLADGTITKEIYVKGKKYDTVFCKKRINLLHEN